ncbi:hypothetical protein [Acidocella sp.]|uniref:hypothetical protein n=1 Tax=Acidocella sp. TaxID=50710 RepID=UPI00260F2540|nr:hypothetical protein [Acidocella sp.]
MGELEIWICKENISRFRERLVAASDEDSRTIILKLLAKEEHTLSRRLSDQRQAALQSQTVEAQRRNHEPQFFLCDGSGGLEEKSGWETYCDPR